MLMRRKSICFAAAVLAAALACSGCGAGGDTTLSNAEFTQQANQVCKETTKSKEQFLQRFFKAHVGSRKIDQSAKEEIATEIVLPALKLEMDGLSALSPPSSREKQVAGILQGLEGLVAQLEQNPELMTSGNPEALFVPINKRATDSGLPSCAEIFISRLG